MISFKTISPSDQSFIEKLYRSTREKELSITNWPEDQKQRFCIMQSIAQEADYKKNYKDASYQLILYKNKAAGRLYLWETDKEIHIIDISLLPEFQGKGIGRQILTDIIQSAKEKNKIVALRVVPDNPAKKLYEKLGFNTISKEATRDYMECNPGSGSV
jgi:ribosomal protein S18 acetylase RimI-like enzyme